MPPPLNPTYPLSARAFGGILVLRDPGQSRVRYRTCSLCRRVWHACSAPMFRLQLAGSIMLRDPRRLASEVLPRHFSHANMSSFQRQLNYFGFGKGASGKGRYEVSKVMGRLRACCGFRWYPCLSAPASPAGWKAFVSSCRAFSIRKHLLWRMVVCATVPLRDARSLLDGGQPSPAPHVRCALTDV